MTVESVTYISDLDDTYPAEPEVATLHEGNDHLRNIKKAILATFPAITGVVTVAHGEINQLAGISDNVQTQIDALQADVDSKLEDDNFVGAGVQSLAGNGYQVLPGGLIIQWGTGQSVATTTHNALVTFPLAFPNAKLVMLAGVLGNPAAATYSAVPDSSASKGSEYVTVLVNGAYASGIFFQWIAVGY